MPKRRESIAPQTDLNVLERRVRMLENQVKALRQPGPSYLQADEMNYEGSPVPWQTMINHPGAHVEATAADPFVYYHPGDDTIGGTTPEGWKALGSAKPFPWIRMRKTTAQTIPWGGDIALTFDDYDISDEGSSYFEVVATNNVKVLVAGLYIMGAQMHWSTVFADAHLISVSDGYLYNTGFTYQDASAFESANQGMVHIHRYPANRQLTLLAAVAGTTDRAISLGYWEVIYLGSFTGLAPDNETE